MTAGSTAPLSRRRLLGAPPRPSAAPIAIDESCLARRGILCRTCGDVCAEAAIMFPPTLGRVAAPAIDAARCTACGDCVGACPVAALAPQPGFSRRPHHAA